MKADPRLFDTKEGVAPLPYPNFAYEKATPFAMHRLAQLFGLSPAPLGQSRVLEVGCRSGVNLVSLGLLLPESQFLGIDADVESISEGVALAKELGATNVEFIATKLQSYEAASAFDYVTAPSFFSVVGQDDREALFRLFESSLSERGLGLLGYHTYPGWTVAKLVREMMLFHTKNFVDRDQKIAEGRKVLNWIVASNEESNPPYKDLLASEMSLAEKLEADAFYENYLSEINDPCFFSDVVSLAAEHNLNYVGDVDFELMFSGNYPEIVQAQLKDITDGNLQEQYFDFTINRRIRNSVITKLANVDRNITTTRLGGFKYRLKMFPKNAIDASVYEEKCVELLAPGTKRIGATVRGKEGVACIDAMARHYPRSLGVKEIGERVASIVETSSDDVILACEEFIGWAVIRGVVWAEGEADLFVTEVSQKPDIFRLSRYQASRHLTVNNTLLQRLEINAVDQYLIPMVDGENELGDLTDEVQKLVTDGTLSLTIGNKDAAGEIPSERGMIESLVKNRLSFYAVNALLVG